MRNQVDKRVATSKSVSQAVKERSRLTKEEWREYTKTVWHIPNTTHPRHPAVFPVEIPRRLVKLFSFVGETVLDPFAGIGTTAVASVELDRKAVCIDQNPSYVQEMRESVAALGSRRSRVELGDARNLKGIRSGSVSLIVTSPPYWDKADYGGNGSNLGAIEGYATFLQSMVPAFEECYRVLKPGRKLCVVTANVSQHTNHGLLTFPLATDFLCLMRGVGFVPVGEVIWSKDKTGGRWGSSGAQRPIFGSYPYPPNFLFKTVHEHILIVSKPPTNPTRGPKVRNYSALMSLNGH